MSQKTLVSLAFVYLLFISMAYGQIKFYDKQDSIEYHHYALILTKGYKISVENGKIKRELVDSSYLDSENFLSFDSAIKLSRAIPKFSYQTHESDKAFTSFKELLSSNKPDTITKLSLEGNDFERLPIFKVLKCRNLTELELVGTSIKKIPRILNWKVFGMDSLRTLSIYNHARGKTIRFKKNDAIEKLVFRDSPYSPVPKNGHKLTNLKEIDFVRNDFSVESKYQLEKYKNLEKVNLSRNNVSIAKLADDTVHSVRNMILSFNGLRAVPSEIGYFTNLEVLQLAENDIESDLIHPSLGNLKKLKTLSFYKNDLDSLPPFIFKLESLVELDLYFNKIEIMPEEIGRLTDLERLYIAHNGFYDVPESIGNLKSLKELYIHHNRISYLPETIKELSSITDFHLQNNYFQGFPTFILGFKKLEDLDISHNEIQTLPPEIVQLEHLKLLWMKGITFSASSKEEAESLKNTLESLQKRGVKVSIDLE
jgi:Leucine-rich repeat (LRR) protein